MKKQLSCGILVICENKLLIGHPTHHSPMKSWSIPKGLLTDDEFPIDCAIRETHEETGLCIWRENLIDLGRRDYLPTKELYLFKTTLDKFPKQELKCLSTFKDHDGNYLPEFDSIGFIDFNDLENYLNPSMYKVIKNILGLYDE